MAISTAEMYFNGATRIEALLLSPSPATVKVLMPAVPGTIFSTLPCLSICAWFAERADSNKSSKTDLATGPVVWMVIRPSTWLEMV